VQKNIQHIQEQNKKITTVFLRSSTLNHITHNTENQDRLGSNNLPIKTQKVNFRTLFKAWECWVGDVGLVLVKIIKE